MNVAPNSLHLYSRAPITPVFHDVTGNITVFSRNFKEFIGCDISEMAINISMFQVASIIDFLEIAG